ncbi:phospholipase D-like domain-containing protein [Phenylobacterium sp. LjRoot225]|uniref:phospholipase D-like domain-containing protein n=1 Tax=Phenylobacterium sp. LjRoot225 TaxID=3342285 RepID=UPI003ECD2973
MPVAPIAGPPAPAVAAAAELHFGGPDRPARVLRDLLLARIEAAPPGSEILWVTYYFRDRGLAQALTAAQRRGVRVRVVLDARPRRADINGPVIAWLRAGLGEGLRVHRSPVAGLRLHTKIYAFSGPAPVAFLGSFNPSGDEPEDPGVLEDIGDQDRGHNLLVEYRDPATVEAVRLQAARIWGQRDVSRFSLWQNRPVRLGATTLYFFPRLRPGVVERGLSRLGPGDHVRAAVSHVERGPFTARLTEAARRGARVELVVHDTRRRVPDPVVAGLSRAGVVVRRYCHPDGLPMHAKFVVVRDGAQRTAWFGSLNYNANSRFLNHEILLRSTDARVVSGLDARFGQISAEAVRLTAGARTARTPFASAKADSGVIRVSGRSGPAAVRALAPDRACGEARGRIPRGRSPWISSGMIWGM